MDILNSFLNVYREHFSNFYLLSVDVEMDSNEKDFEHKRKSQSLKVPLSERPSKVGGGFIGLAGESSAGKSKPLPTKNHLFLYVVVHDSSELKANY